MAMGVRSGNSKGVRVPEQRRNPACSNRYCSNCKSTQTFLDVGKHLTCTLCSKRLHKATPAEAVKPVETPPEERRRRRAM